MTLFLKILKFTGSLMLVALLSASGGLLGAYLGGNYWVSFRLFGVRGYEALGLVGFIAGLLGGGILIRMLLLNRKGKEFQDMFSNRKPR
ncbi:MAG: hypothetical protein P8Y37_04670 [Anaerolineales bacterium]